MRKDTYYETIRQTNRGSHYQKYKIQPSKFVIENELLYPEGCAIKYIIRHRDKGKKQDKSNTLFRNDY